MALLVADCVFGKYFYISIKILMLFLTYFFIHSSHQQNSVCETESRPQSLSESSKSLGKSSDNELFLMILPYLRVKKFW